MNPLIHFIGEGTEVLGQFEFVKLVRNEVRKRNESQAFRQKMSNVDNHDSNTYTKPRQIRSLCHDLPVEGTQENRTLLSNFI
jgi:hypothetical protein